MSARITAREIRIQSEARKIYTRAILRGDLVRKPCCICGGTYRVAGHHPDYSRPLFVIWLCTKHHVRLHYAPELIIDELDGVCTPYRTITSMQAAGLSMKRIAAALKVSRDMVSRAIHGKAPRLLDRVERYITEYRRSQTKQFRRSLAA